VLAQRSKSSATSLILASRSQAPGFLRQPAADERAVSNLPSPTTSISEPEHISISYLGQISPPLPTRLKPTPGLDHGLLPLPSLTIYSALYTTGRMLGIPCVTSMISKSKLAPAEIPLSLQPTPTQLYNVHYLFIDRFPLPGLRNNMIELQDHFNAEEFIADIFTMPSFIIASGYQCWDPAAWAVAAEFKSKWEFLF
jgi:hypothetical protein